MLALVDGLGERLNRRYEGAWDAIAHQGPDSASQAAGSIVELIKGALRESAPQEQIDAWLAGLDSPVWGRDAKGFPTYRARAHFLLAQRGVPAKSAEAFANNLVTALADLEEIKHGRTEASMEFVVSTLLLFEAMLVAAFTR